MIMRYFSNWKINKEYLRLSSSVQNLCCPPCVSIQFQSFPAHLLQGHAIFVWSQWVNGKQLSSIMVSVVFLALLVAKHVPRLKAHRATPTMGKNKDALTQAFMWAYPSQCSLSHAAYVSLSECCSSIRAPPTESIREKGSERGDASVLRRWWVWGWMLCLRSLCYSMHCRGKVSEEALHVGSGCEAFHLETNAFPHQWAFSLSQASVCIHVWLRNKKDMHRQHVHAPAELSKHRI